MGSKTLAFLLFAVAIITVHCNSEGDALNAWKIELLDPNNVLQSWDPTLVNPCTWLHVTCNGNDSVVRVDLGNAAISGPLVPQLGLLSNLQYLEVFNNSISGPIPGALGNLTALISLGLNHNQLSGPIPATLGYLKHLWFMRLNSNKLTGIIPSPVIQLILWGNLRIMNVSDNHLAGRPHHAKNTGIVETTIIQDGKMPKLESNFGN